MITANQLVKELERRHLTLALAESVTCGMAAHMLAAYQGTGNVLTCSIVAYQEEAKIKILKVPQSLIKKYTAESEKVTVSMARGLEKLNEADIMAAVTGLASEGGSETKQKPVGTVFYAVIYKGKCYSLKHKFNGTPLQVRKKCCIALYKFILQIINKS